MGFSCLLAAVFSVVSPWRCSELGAALPAEDRDSRGRGRGREEEPGKVAVTAAEASEALLKMLGRLLLSKRSAPLRPSSVNLRQPNLPYPDRTAGPPAACVRLWMR